MNLTATLIGQIMVFGVLVWFVKRFLWGPILHVLDDRKRRITDGLAAAERGHHEKELADRRAKEVIRDAKERSVGIINQAQKRADEILDESKELARIEGERLITAAHLEIEQEVNRAKEQLRREVLEVALAGVEKVLMREVDIRTHNEIFESLAAKL
uniref:ATP synthase subunit b n=1 Tax=Candidatus Kentrum sp. MB TaxID=2138164 RepID=A0A451B7Z6_9GAMM|nr:MAG: F-type H+-transporting ATPase subunit b [Candidatus Kentron sp. MB]VFK27721.1 MAG: F-type H+-transporting ATPase subunit b [Candidatus Kentron sp. MB]VFK74405.1 MAG: F-type H+-transporting ATPase subunit b [Candidatus Kentron sp. MB]